MLRTLIRAAALATTTVAAGTALPAMAQSADYGLHAGALEVPVNKSQVVTTDRPIGKAMVGNAEIADVLPISERSVYVLGKKMGTTSLTLYDRANRVLAVMDVAVGPDVDGLRGQMASLIPGQKIDARISNESIILSGMVSDPGAADRAAQIAKAYAGDKVVNLITVGGSQQVMLEVRFAEINRQTGEQLGVSGFGLSNNGTFDAVTGATASLIPGANGAGVPTLSAITDTFGIFRKVFNIGNVNIEGILNALERKGLAKTLAEPTLIALSGERASFLAGGEFPIPVVQNGSSGGGAGNGGGTSAITVEYKQFGVSLGFTPTVLGDKVINLVVEPEVSSIDPSASITINGLVVPGLQTRRASTTLELRDGESFAIAGLLRRDFQTTIRQLPILGSLPIIGSLFRSSSFQKGETELLIVVTPRLVAPIRPDQVRLPTDRVKDPKELDTLLNGDDYQTRKLPPPAPAPVADPAAPTAPAKEPGYDY
ncbi:type II and III secretion system protein family protein [Novosphingobium tardum]|uniref:Type II and III secretion system protein family protein n=1 Tax=Novosphingobium tardum TaxID=1538021 RepID=A0ABV8RKR5_9SPHN